MAVEQFANNATTAVVSGGLTAPASGTVETWAVASPAAFPTASASATPPTQFHIGDPALPSELIAVTATSGGTWTVTRGAEGTIPVAHSPGFSVTQDVSAGWLAQVMQALVSQTAWYNVRQYGAVGNGSADDTAAIQAAMNACAAGGGGTVYFPGGSAYKITSALTWTSTAPLYMLGDGTSGVKGAVAGAGPAIHMAFAPGHAIHVSMAVANTGMFTLNGIDILADGTNSSGAAADYVAVYCNNLAMAAVYNSQITVGAASTSFNTGIQFSGCFQSFASRIYGGGETQGLWMNGGAACAADNCFLGSTAGNGFGAVRMDNAAGTLSLYNVITFRGDRGLIVGKDGTSPLFVFVDNLQVNNCHVAGIELQNGGAAWINQYWVSNNAVSSTILNHGINVGPGYNGALYVSSSSIGNVSGHGIWIQGGTGYVIADTGIGRCGSNAANTYDDIHIAAAASNVTITGCHFDTDWSQTLPFTGINPRSAIMTEAGAAAVNVTGCQFHAPASDYATATVVDNAAVITGSGNTGWKPGMQVTGTTGPVIGTSMAALSGGFPVQPNEGVNGTVYRLKARGHGTQATGTAADLNFQVVWGGIVLASGTLAGSVIGAANSFRWKLLAEVQVITQGSSGAVVGDLTMSWNAAGVTITASNNAQATQGAAGPVTVSTVVQNNIQLQASWSTTAGSPTITADASYLECVRN